ncbi:IS701 family transposase [Streptomyces sp. CA-106131]|uniref:IS701 family transposase n=1 Tax=Streptomyces sp. CA-106131 TaxID=3240045 RepID=UPI003D92AF9B
MTARRPCPPAPGPLEGYAARFDDLFSSLAQRRGFREYLTGLLAPRDRNKTLTCLAGAEPVVGAQHPAVQRLQFFLSESTWDPERVNARRLELLLQGEATAPHAGGVLVIDDSGDRKDGTATAHVGRQWLGRYGKTDNAVVTVTTLWADERLYYPLHAVPYTPAHHFPRGKSDPAFRTKWKIAAQLACQARSLGIAFRAAVADGAYGDLDDFRCELHAAKVPFVMAVKRRRGVWAYGDQARTPVDAARELAWHGPEEPGAWTPVVRTFRDGHTATWWAADATLGFWGPDGLTRLVVATADPSTLPEKATWYLATDLPRPGSPRAAESPYPPADLAEVVRIYGIRNWIEQGYKQVKDELGWADFQVRTDVAIRRHQTLVNCAFAFCWEAGRTSAGPESTSPLMPEADAGERGPGTAGPAPTTVLAEGDSRRPRLADPVDRAATLVAGLVQRAPSTRTPSPDRRGHHRTDPEPLPPELTNHR